MVNDVQNWCQESRGKGLHPSKREVKTHISPKMSAIPQFHLMTAFENMGPESLNLLFKKKNLKMFLKCRANTN